MTVPIPDSIDFTKPEILGVQIYCPTLKRYEVISRPDFAVRCSSIPHWLVRCKCGTTHQIPGREIPQEEIDRLIQEVEDPKDG